ncbi:GTPase Era [Alphaproteobacteria bacterium endosymbiont of Tiliacea citrago]|uniref:GTPase Era n=1 Tax=Alphaproteobacteria bacterium endosymbiont of Tiliacea citrago TaxID=3077944 RepID=UPI00313DA7E0
MQRINIPIIGLPNVGKSTLLNSMIGEKVSIVTPKPHTTRTISSKVKKLANSEEVVFVDTPGIDKFNNKLGTVIFNNMQSYLKSLNAMMLVVDCTNPRIERFLPYLEKSIIVLNKIDYMRKPKLLPIIEQLQSFNPKAIFCVCAKTGDGVKDILEYLKKESFFEEVEQDFVYEENKEDEILNYACEVVREKILLEFEQEVPYNIFIKVKDFSIPQNSAWKIFLDILVPRESYKPILIGKKCEKLKNIGKVSRIEISLKLKQSGYLGLKVVVDEDLWKKEETYNSLGWSIK